MHDLIENNSVTENNMISKIDELNRRAWEVHITEPNILYNKANRPRNGIGFEFKL